MSDLISRRALLDAMPKNDELFSLDVRRMICDAPAVAAMPRWIRVEERLPETQVDVLLFVKHDIGGTSYLAIGCRAQWTPNRYYINGASSCSIDAARVTHWMPLPEPPKEET